MLVHTRKLDKLKKRLQQVLAQQDLQAHRRVIQQLSDDLDIDALDCAASLLCMSQPHLLQTPSTGTAQDLSKGNLPPAFKSPIYRNVRYRLDVGTQHQIDQEQLLAVLIEESGVDKKRIARVDIRDRYTLVDLPDGMPADIFQLLSEVTVNGHALNIKRVKPNRKKFRDSRRGND